MTKKIIILLSTILLFAGVAHSQEVKGYPEKFISIGSYVFERDDILYFEDDLELRHNYKYHPLHTSTYEKEYKYCIEWVQDESNRQAIAKKLGFKKVGFYIDCYNRPTLVVSLRDEIIKILHRDELEEEERIRAAEKKEEERVKSSLDAWLKD